MGKDTVPSWYFLCDGTVLSRYFLRDGTVPLQYFLRDGTVPSPNHFLIYDQNNNIIYNHRIFERLAKYLVRFYHFDGPTLSFIPSKYDLILLIYDQTYYS